MQFGNQTMDAIVVRWTGQSTTLGGQRQDCGQFVFITDA